MEDNLYFKSNEKYIPISFKKIVTKNWDKSLIFVKVGDKNEPVKDNELQEVLDDLNKSDALLDLNATFLVSTNKLEFELLGKLSDIKNKHICVNIKNTDDVSEINEIKKIIKKFLKPYTNVITLPVPITLEEYKDILKIKERRDTRRQRRGR